MTNIKNRTRNLGGLLCLLAAATLFTCEKVPDYCGKGSWYDPGYQFCFAGKPYNQCGGNSYNPLTEGCIQGVEVGTRCSDETVVKLGTPCGGYTLTASATPEIGGVVTHTPSDRTTFAAGERVVLSASPNVDFEFVGWAGADTSKDATVTITMNANKPVVAMFKSVKPGTLTTTAFPDNGGYITRNPDAEMYATGETVTVTATAETGYRFGGWSGDTAASDESVTIVMEESKTLVAMFTPIVYTLTVNANPTDGGAVFVNGTALAGTTSQNIGTEITVEARAAGGYVFTGWSGSAAAAVDNQNNPKITVTLEGDAAITANFRAQSGGGTVTPPPVTPPGVVYGSVTDTRDGRTYRTVKIGEQTWMAENLNFRTSSGSWCYGEDSRVLIGFDWDNHVPIYEMLSSSEIQANCNTYGRLYDWATAMDIDARYNEEIWGGSDVGHQGVCPTEWHLSSSLEWDILMVTVGGTNIAGGKLKSTSGWYYGYSKDEYGWSALPGGHRYTTNDSLTFSEVGNYGYWRTATEAYQRYMYYGNANVIEIDTFKSDGVSVRCIKDD